MQQSTPLNVQDGRFLWQADRAEFTSAETVRNVLATRQENARSKRIPPWTNGRPLFFQV